MGIPLENELVHRGRLTQVVLQVCICLCIVGGVWTFRYTLDHREDEHYDWVSFCDTHPNASGCVVSDCDGGGHGDGHRRRLGSGGGGAVNCTQCVCISLAWAYSRMQAARAGQYSTIRCRQEVTCQFLVLCLGVQGPGVLRLREF